MNPAAATAKAAVRRVRATGLSSAGHIHNSGTSAATASIVPMKSRLKLMLASDPIPCAVVGWNGALHSATSK